MTRRRTARLLIGLAALLAAATAASAWWRYRELSAAREDVSLGRLAPALHRLERLEWLPPFARSAEQSFLLGMARWSAGRVEPALEAFARIPSGSELATKAAMFRAEAAIRGGRLRAAEESLQGVVAATSSGYEPALEALEVVYRLEARFGELRDVLRARARISARAALILLDLWRLDRSTVPVESLRAGLDEAARRAGGVEDDRLWLGRARVALLAAQPDEARTWLDRCREAGSDPAVWRAWLDWAALAEQPAEVARALDELGGARITLAESCSWRAWLARRVGEPEEEWDALQKALELEPHQPRTLERLAALARERGDPAQARGYRERKAAVDQALLDYDVRIKALSGLSPRESPAGAQCLELARLARAAGRPFDSAAWATLAAAQEPPGGPARELADRQGRLAAAAAAPAGELANSWTGRITRKAGTGAAPRATARAGQEPMPEFADDAATAGLTFRFDNGESPLHQMPEPLSGGVGLLDYDGDGWLDVYVTQGGAFPPRPGQRGDRLFRNRRDGSFEDATDRAGIGSLPQGYGHGVAVADYDGDGRPDLFLTRWRSYALYRNRGDGTFEDATERAGLGGGRDWPTSAAFADLDGDGDLDLYVCHYLQWDPDNPKLCRNAKTNAYVSCSPLQLPATADHVFRNDGGRFVDVTREAGFLDPAGRGLGVVAAQLDDDMKIDLFVANDMTANYLFHNLGGFRFREVGDAAGVASNAEGGFRAGMGIGCGDADGDGRPDLVVTNFYGEGLSLYQNMGGLFFVERARETGLAQASRYRLGFGVAFLDADNDGELDLMTANGHLDDLGDVPYRMPLQFFHAEAGVLRDRTSEAGDPFRQPRLGRALAVGDLDNDGRPDALVIDHNAPLAYLHNRSRSAGRWVTLRLEGTKSNRDAVGAVVTVRAGGREQTLQRFGGGSYQAAGDPRIHAGLGGASRVDEVEVRWPSGTVDRWTGLSAGTGYLLREGEAAARPLAGFSRDVAAPGEGK